MKRYAMMETRWGKVLFGLFLFVMLLLARDTLITSCILGFTRSQVLMVGAICLLGVVFLVCNRGRWKEILTDRRMIVMGLSAVVLLIPMLSKQDWQLMYFSILLCLLTAVFLTYLISWQEAAKYYVVILAALGLYSLVGMYVLKGLASKGLISPTVFLNSASMEFYNFGLTFVVPWEYWHRNFGIFREPGVYQFFLLLGIYLNHYAVSWKNSRSMWLVTALLCLTMVSTFAIGGCIEMVLLAVFLYFDKHYYRTKIGRALGVTALAVLAGAVVFIILQIRKPGFELTVFYEFYDMFRRLVTDSNSLIDRLSAILVNAQLFLDKPLLGDSVTAVLHGTAHNTSSTLILYAILGVVGGTLNVAAWVALLWKRERNVVGNLALLVILFMSFNTQNLVADVFFWLFPYMALTEKLLPLLNRSERKA